MSHRRAIVLFSGPLARVIDVDCHAPRAPAGPEREVEFHELVFVRRGVFAAQVGRRSIVVDPAQVLCFNAGQVARFSHPMAHGDSYTALELPSHALLDVTTRYNPWLAERPDRPLPLSQAAVTPEVLLRVQCLRGLLHAPDPDPDPDPMHVDEAVLRIVDAVMRAARDAESLPKRIARRRETASALRDLAERARLVLAAAPAAPVSLGEVARSVGSSPFHLARVFSQEFGVPLHQYRLRLRLAMALDRIAEGEDNLSALAHELGFASHSHLTLAFRTLFGVPPSAVRRQLTRGRHRSLATRGLVGMSLQARTLQRGR